MFQTFLITGCPIKCYEGRISTFECGLYQTYSYKRMRSCYMVNGFLEILGNRGRREL